MEFFELFKYDFFLNALIAGFLASIALGIIGTFVVVKRIVFISGGISHTAYGGIGLAILIGLEPILGALIFSILAAIFISILRKQKNQNEDLLIGIMWAIGMSLGIIFANLKTGYVPNLMSYLFGNILMIPRTEVYLIAILDLLIITFVVIYFSELQAITFDEEFAFSLGLPVNKIYLGLLIAISLSTVILIKIVGIILVVALLAIPGAISIKFSKSLKSMIILSILISFLINTFGLFLSYFFDLPGGATIILLGGIIYIITNFINIKRL